MLTIEERRNVLVNLMSDLHPVVRLSDMYYSLLWRLADELDVSIYTVKRDLKWLADAGACSVSWGGSGCYAFQVFTLK